MSRKHSAYSGYSFVNLNFRVIGDHARLVADAADKRSETMAAFMRRIILEWSAAELGQQAPDLSEYAGDIIATAARKVNMSPQEFTRNAARESAARIMHANSNGADIVPKLSQQLRQALYSSGDRGELKVAGIAGGRRQ